MLWNVTTVLDRSCFTVENPAFSVGDIPDIYRNYNTDKYL